jgi:hypothetical protein
MSRPILREGLRVAAVAALTLVTLVAARVGLDGHHGGLLLNLARGVLGSWLRHDHSGLAMAVLLAIALSYPLRAVGALRGGEDDAIRPLAVLGAVAGTATAFTVVLRVASLRAEAFAALDASPYRTLGAFEGEVTTLAIAGAGALLLVLLWGAVGGAVARRRGGGPFALAAVIGAAVLGGLTASAVARSAWASLAYSDPCADPEVGAQLRYAAFTEHGAPLVDARAWLLAVAVAASVALIVLARRAPTPLPGKRAFAAPTALLLAGLAAFAGTRAAAHDADHPPPLWRLSEQTMPDGTPAALRCRTDVCDAPTLALDARGFSFHGAPVASTAELALRLDAMRGFWQQVQPGKRFPGVLLASFPPDAPMESVAPMLATARAAGYPVISVLRDLPTARWPTRTLGELAYSVRVCCTPLPAAMELPERGAWGRVLEAAPPP